MSELSEPSPWARRRFGDLAQPLREVIPAALHAAHERAFAGQVGTQLVTNEPYGHIWLILPDELLKRLGGIDGIGSLRPKGARHPLPTIGESKTILYPYRYAGDDRRHFTDVRMNVSELRANLLGLNEDAPRNQLTIDHAADYRDMSGDEIEAEFEAEERRFEELATGRRLVLIPYASNSRSGILSVSWGEAILTGSDGTLEWIHHEKLPYAGPASGGGDFGGMPRPAPSWPGSGSGSIDERFDAAPLEELELGIRAPLTSPSPERPVPQPETGSDE